MSNPYRPFLSDRFGPTVGCLWDGHRFSMDACHNIICLKDGRPTERSESSHRDHPQRHCCLHLADVAVGSPSGDPVADQV